MNPAFRSAVSLFCFVLLSTFCLPSLAGGFIELEGAFTAGLSRDVSNPWWPLPEGTRYVYLAEEDDECVVSLLEVLPPAGAEGGYRTQIAGVEVRTLRDVEVIDHDDECDGLGDLEILESTLDWYAQDDRGNVWYFGEHTVALDVPQDDCDDYTQSDDVWGLEGCLDGSWVAGADIADTGAIAEEGIIMLAEPAKGLFYFQEYYEEVATDMGKVLNFKDVDSPLYGDMEDCVVIKEWAPLDPGNVEHKYYCYGLGLLQVQGNAGGKTVWTDLVEVIEP